MNGTVTIPIEEFDKLRKFWNSHNSDSVVCIVDRSERGITHYDYYHFSDVAVAESFDKIAAELWSSKDKVVELEENVINLKGVIMELNDNISKLKSPQRRTWYKPSFLFK